MQAKNTFCKLTTIRSERKEGTKTVYTEKERTVENIDREKYNNIVDAAPFFRRLGGSEYLERGYTSRGYNVIKIISKSPCKDLKTERIFYFD